MTNADRLLGEFIDAWNAGERPDPDAFTRRAEGVDRVELEAGIEAFLAVAPLPRYDAATLAALRAEPAVRAMARAAAADATAMPTLLARLRARARASLDDVARALGRAFGWDAAGERRARGYLEALEAGRLDPSGVSRRLTVALADALRAPASALEAARPDHPGQAALLWRAEEPGQEAIGPHLDVVADALRADDEVARLFTGGPDA
jgi:hypothetical protein